MSKKKKPKFKYFSCVKGKVVPRFGTASYIGARRTHDGFEFDEEKVVAIPEDEVTRYGREYRNALRVSHGGPCLKERTKAEFGAFLEKRAEQQKRAAEKAKTKRVDKPKDDSSGG